MSQVNQVKIDDEYDPSKSDAPWRTWDGFNTSNNAWKRWDGGRKQTKSKARKSKARKSKARKSRSKKHSRSRRH